MKQIVTMVCVFLGLLSGSFGTVHAQTKPAPATPAATAPAVPRYQPGKLSTDPAQYIADVQAMMVSTNNAGARVIAARFKELWASNRLTTSQQRSIVALSQTMLAKHFRARPHFETLFNTLVAGTTLARLTDAQMLSLGAGFPETGWFDLAYSLLSQVAHGTPLGMLHATSRQNGDALAMSYEMCALVADAACIGVTQVLGPFGMVLGHVNGLEDVREWLHELNECAAKVHRAAQPLHFLD